MNIKVILNLFIGLLYGLIPECFLSYVLMKILNGNWMTFIIIYLSIQLLYLSVWIIRTIISSISFTISGKHQISEHICKQLAQNKFPDPYDYYIDDGKTYFEDIAYNNLIDPNIRINAMHIVGELKTYESMGHFLLLWRMQKALKMALEKYHTMNFSYKDEITNT